MRSDYTSPRPVLRDEHALDRSSRSDRFTAASLPDDERPSLSPGAVEAGAPRREPTFVKGPIALVDAAPGDAGSPILPVPSVRSSAPASGCCHERRIGPHVGCMNPRRATPHQSAPIAADVSLSCRQAANYRSRAPVQRGAPGAEQGPAQDGGCRVNLGVCLGRLRHFRHEL